MITWATDGIHCGEHQEHPVRSNAEQMDGPLMFFHVRPNLSVFGKTSKMKGCFCILPMQGSSYSAVQNKGLSKIRSGGFI